MSKWIVLNEREFPAAMVYACCCAIYGKSIARGTWSNWRKWSRLSPRRRRFTFEQFCFVAAIAWIRSQQRLLNRHRVELTRKEVLAIADSVELQDRIIKAVQAADLELCVGSDAPDALKLHGIDASLSQLHQLVPGFSVARVYRIDHLIHFFD